MRRHRVAASLAVLLGIASTCAAKPPTITALFPAGAERGQTVSVKLSGNFDHWPAKCWLDGEGLTVTPAEEKGVLSIAVAGDALPGVRWFRVFDQDGASSSRPFVVGVLREIAEVEPNDDPRKPQKVEEPRVTINGRLAKNGDVDGFAVELKAGAVLTADLQAARPIGSPMDGVLQVVSADGFVMAQNDDDVGMDPRIVFEAPSDGTYIVRLFAFPAAPDSSIRFSGGDAYVYRLTLTTGGFVDHAFPLAVAAGGPAEVAAVGPNVPAPGPGSALAVPAGDDPGRVALAHPSLPGIAEVRRVAGPTAVEAEVAADDHPQPLADLGSVSGRLDLPAERDIYRIALKNGETRVFRVESREFGLPLDPVVAVLDAEGKALAEADDRRRSSKDPELKFAPKADGEYRVVVRDLHGRGGPRYAYLLSVAKPEPDFELTLAADQFEVTPGKESKVAVTIDRREGFAGEIEIRAEGLPAGVEATKVVSKSGDDSAKSVTLEIRAAADSNAPAGPFRVFGRPVEGDGRDRPARVNLADFGAETEQPWLTVLPAPK
ncbi:PPC domain-containing protein [Paludisphaera sp.]|uniref:PPC domain-containing protein n=1 Tax=Paludisphaera sp. TaxID=2017432 RepID=UPI00301D21CB